MKQSQITLILLTILIIIGILVFVIKSKKNSQVTTDSASLTTSSLPAAKMTQEALTTKKNAIQGTWQSVLDVKSQLEFTGNKKSDYYDGKIVSTDTYVLNPEAGDAGFVIEATTKDGDAMIYSVVDLTDTSLMLTLKGGNGQTLSFTRIK